MIDIAPLLLLHWSLTSVLWLRWMLVQVLTATALRHNLSLYLAWVYLVSDAVRLATTAAADYGITSVLELELWSGRRLHCFHSLLLYVPIPLLFGFLHWQRGT